MRLERKAPLLEEADVDHKDVALELLRAGRQEEGVVLAARRQDPPAVLAEAVLERRIEGDIARVVVKQVDLDLVRSRPRQAEVVERTAVGRDGGRVGSNT